MKILFVCLGNICRSPLAEGILKEYARVNDLAWEIESCGTGMWHVGQKPDKRSIAIAEKMGVSIARKRARQLNMQDFEAFDKIYVMDSQNLSDVLTKCATREQEQKVDMILNLVNPGSNKPVPDPYYGEFGFENVYQLLDEASQKIIELYA